MGGKPWILASLAVFALLPLACQGYVAYAIESYHSGYILRTINAGKNWTTVRTTARYLEAVGFRGDMRVHAVGDGGASFRAMLTNNRTEFCDPYNAPDCRTPWTMPPVNFSENPIDTTTDLNFIAFFNDNTGVLGGRLGRIYQTRNGGAGWTKIETGTILDLNGVGISEKTGRGLAVGHQGIALRSGDWGWHWDIISSLQSRYFTFYDAALNYNGSNSVIVGAQGEIQVSTDNMTTFAPAFFNGTVLLRNYELLSVEFFDEVRAIAVGSACMVILSDDGGLNWFRKNLECLDGASTHLYDVSVTEQGQAIIAARDHFYYTYDHGETWNRTKQLFELDVNHITEVQMMAAPVPEVKSEVLTQKNFTGNDYLLVWIAVKNIGTLPLKIENINITSACKCTSLSTLSTPYFQEIQPGETGFAVVEYETAGLGAGTYSSRVNIYHNGPTRVQRVDILLQLQVEIIYIALTVIQRYWLALMLCTIIAVIVIYFQVKSFCLARRKREYNRWKLKAYRKVAREEVCPHCCVVYGCDFIGYFHNRAHAWVYDTSDKRARDMDTDSEKERSSDDDSISSVSSVSSDEDLESVEEKVVPLQDVTDDSLASDRKDTKGEKKQSSEDSDSSDSSDSDSDSKDDTDPTSTEATSSSDPAADGVDQKVSPRHHGGTGVAAKITSSEDSSDSSDDA